MPDGERLFTLEDVRKIATYARLDGGAFTPGMIADLDRRGDLSETYASTPASSAMLLLYRAMVEYEQQVNQAYHDVILALCDDDPDRARDALRPLLPHRAPF